MCTQTYHREKRAYTSLVLLTLFVRKLKRSLSILAGARSRTSHPDHETDQSDYGEEEFDVSGNVAVDVKEGCLAVIAVKGHERKRFIVELEVLSNPKFLSLLNLAEEEYGFRQSGALVVPCSPQEFEKILMR